MDPLSHPPTDTPPPTTDQQVPDVSLFQIFSLFFSIGALSFGGGLIAWIYREVVEKRKWLTDHDFVGGLTLAQVLPGINMANITVYTGQRLRGAMGSVAALSGLLVFPFFFILFLLQIYHQIIAFPGVQGFLDGMAVAAVGLFMSVGFKSARSTIRSLAPAIIVVFIIVTVGFLRWPIIPVALTLGPLSVALAYYQRRRQNA